MNEQAKVFLKDRYGRIVDDIKTSEKTTGNTVRFTMKLGDCVIEQEATLHTINHYNADYRELVHTSMGVKLLKAVVYPPEQLVVSPIVPSR